MSYCAHCGSKVGADVKFCQSCGKPPSGAPGVKPSIHPVVIVAIVAAAVLGFVMIGGIVAAIAIPNFLNAIDRGKQKRTMADMRSIATAIEMYGVDHDVYPTASDLDALEASLVPTYLDPCPRVDGWGHAIVLEPSSWTSYTLLSHGKDGLPEQSPRGGATQDFDCDIIFTDGQFTQWPEGIQH